MKSILWLALIVLLGTSVASSSKEPNVTPVEKGIQQSDQTDEKAVTGVVEAFGKRLQMVSLMAPKDLVQESMKKYYGDLLSAPLLAKWQDNPESAPGRMVSSPWPDRIVVQSVEKLSENNFQVKGDIIEITSAEQASGGVAAKRAITLEVRRIDNRWLIDAATLGAYED